MASLLVLILKQYFFTLQPKFGKLKKSPIWKKQTALYICVK